jgi:hypothetical protein
MRPIVAAVLGFLLAGVGFAQRGGQAPTGIGNTGFNYSTPPRVSTGFNYSLPPGRVTNSNFPGRLGATMQGIPPRVNHPGHGRTIIVPYPVYYGGYSYDPSMYPQQQQYPEDQQSMMIANPPPVIINPGYVPDRAYPVVRDYNNSDLPEPGGMRLHESPSRPYADAQTDNMPRRTGRLGNEDKATVYLLAFRDHTIVQALGFWMEGSNLHYVSVEHTLNQVSLDLIDRDLSQRLNDERGVEFRLPAR